jgi:hypothetical protein
MITLTKEERLKFAAYLRQEAESADAMARQANTMDGLDMVVKKYRTQAMSCILVAKDLESIEEMILG